MGAPGLSSLLCVLLLLHGHCFVLRSTSTTNPPLTQLTRPASVADPQLTESIRLQKARLRLAEAQGIVPIGASEDSGFSLKNFSLAISSTSVSKVREISWKVAEPAIPYDPQKAASKLWGQPLRWLVRNVQIFVPLTWFALTVLADAVTKREEENRAMRADQLLNIISSQSPALIKAGQALSSRPDLLPKDYLDALQKLQDRCPPFSNEAAFQLFYDELGREFSDLIELEGTKPVAAASIGQVYKGVLRSNGAKVAVKVQRPGCEESIAVDLYVMRWYSQQIQRVLKYFGRSIDLVSVIDDFGDLIYREIDYRAEAVNGQRFAELYSVIPDVFVPKIYPDLSTSKVLTMEWVDGARLNDRAAIVAMGLEPSKFVDTLVQCSLRQMLENGFFHADPHAGNLLAMSSGKLCYLDFGMVSYVEASQRYSIIEAVVHLVNRDFASLAELYKRMGFIPRDVDSSPIIEALQLALPDVLNAPVGELNFKNVISKLGDVMYKFPFSLPPFYIAIIRCLGVLEGVAIQVDQDFRIISDAYPYIASRLLSDPSKELRSALLQLLFREGEPRWERLEELLDVASETTDYDVVATADQLVSYLMAPESEELRRLVTLQAVELVDGVGADAVQYVVSLAGAGALPSLSPGELLPLLRAPDQGSRWSLLADMLNEELAKSTSSLAPSPALRSASKFLSYIGTNSIDPDKASALVRRVSGTLFPPLTSAHHVCVACSCSVSPPHRRC